MRTGTGHGSGHERGGDRGRPVRLRLADAGDAKPAWVTLLTTEHYNLQSQRVATISETTGRASVFLGSVSSGLVALGFSAQDDRGSLGFVAFAGLVLSALVFLGVVTFARTVQTSVDDAVYAERIDTLRDHYAQLVPDLAPMLAVARGGDVYQHRTGRRAQRLLTVSGSLGVLTGLLAGGDAGLLLGAVTGSLPAALVAGTAVAVAAIALLLRHQDREWRLVMTQVRQGRAEAVLHRPAPDRENP